MKKILLILTAGLLMATPACKKGENDPFLSLKSRKARLAGEYEFISLESFNETLVEGVFPYRTNIEIKIEGGVGTHSTATASEDGGIISGTKIKNILVDRGEFIIDKDGSWEFTMNTTITWEEEGGGVNDHFEFTEIQTITESGDWEFLEGKSDGFKSKERVLFSKDSHQAFVQTNMKVVFIDGSSSDWPGEKHTVSHNGPTEVIYEIDGLKHKEMILKRPKDGAKVQGEGEDAPVSVSLITEGMVELHLKQL